MSRKKFMFWIPTATGQSSTCINQQVSVDTAGICSLGHEYASSYTASSDIARMRNLRVETARADGYDYLMMQDSDIYCPTNQSAAVQLYTALEQTGAAAAVAVCGLRRNVEQRQLNVYPLQTDADVYEVEKAGTGVIMIDLAQINSIAEVYDGPWFAMIYEDKRQTRCKTGEDIFFAQVLRGHDRKIVACGNIPTVHVYSDHRTLAYNPGGATEA
jgi:hypothetical protein